MRKTGFLEFVFYATLLLFSLTIAKFDVRASPGTIGVPTNFPTIQEAINAASAGDTIFVYNGTYPEHIVVNKTVTLIGENRSSTIIDGQGIGTVVNITSNNVVFNGFTVKNGTYDVYLYYSSGSKAINSTITDGSSEAGILLDHSNNNMIANNTIQSSRETGIYLYYSSGNTISQNNSTNNLVGIWLLYSNGNTIIKNNMTKNSYGVELRYSSSNTLKDNNMTDNNYNFGVQGTSLTHFIQDIDTSNKINGKPIYYWVNQRDKQIPSDAGYVAAVNSTNITVKNLDIRSNREGVLMAYTNNSVIESNTLSNSSESAIYLYNSNANTITRNTITTARDGVTLDSSNGNVASNNAIAKCDEYGIWLASSSSNAISSNTATDSYIGAILYFSGGNIIAGNNLTRNSYGIWLSSSNNNKIHHNNFNNTNQVRSSGGSVNLWDDGHPSGGNYWSNYAGTDLYWGPHQNKTGSDGMGDTPRTIDGSNRDNYPLMSPYEYWSNPILGDVNKDTRVNAKDLSQLATAYGSTPEKPKWNPSSDLNSDDTVDVSDLIGLGKNYGKIWP